MRALPLLLALACAPTPDTDGPGAPSGRWPACDPAATAQTLSFVHVNDMHGGYNFDPAHPGESKLSRAVGYARAVMAEQPYTVFTNGGDDFEKGSAIEYLSEGHAVTELVQGMGLDLRAIGNHDYAWGADVFLAHTLDPTAVVVASNAEYVGDDPDAYGAVQTAVLEVGCLRVGVFSQNTRPFGGSGGQYAGSYLPEIVENTYDLTADIQRWMDRLEAEDVDLVVAANHLGLGTDRALAETVDGIDLILSSHSHDLTLAPVEVGGTRIIQAGSGSDWIVRLDVEVDLDTRRPTGWTYTAKANAPGTLPVADDVEDTVRRVFTEWAPGFWDPVATSQFAYGAESTAGLLAEMAVEAYAADVAVFDADSMNRGLPGGPLTLQDFVDLFNVEREPPATPSWNGVTLADATGAELQRLKDALRPGQRWAGPDTLDPDTTYVLATHKRQAEYPDLFLGGMPTLTNLRPAAEVWQMLRQVGTARQAACRYLDVDAPIPGCTP